MDHLETFQQHCKIYYQKSLSRGESKSNDDERTEKSKFVLDTFEHHIRYSLLSSNNDNATSLVKGSPSATATMQNEESKLEQKEFLTSARVKKYSDILKKCGLHIEYNDDLSRINYLPQHILIEYSNIKDTERRNAHQIQIKERKGTFLRHLQECIENGNETHQPFSKFMGEYDVTTQSYLKHVRSCVKTFVAKYQKNIGSHSLLAGMKKLIEKQIEMDEVICMWNFDSTIITESSLFLLSNDNVTGKGEQGYPASSYMIKSINVLMSFMVYCGKKRDVESHDTNENENTRSLVSFHVHPFISNAFLKQVHHELPSTLDAKPAGTFCSYDEIIANDEALTNNSARVGRPLVRTNIVGQLDESYFVKAIQWAHSLCEIM